MHAFFLHVAAFFASLSMWGAAPIPAVPPVPHNTESASATARPAVDVPIYAYHHVREIKSTDSAAAREFIVTPAVFEAQMAYLEEHGYTTISLKQLEDYFDHGIALPPKAVIITFDDSWGSQYDNAFHSLVKHHLTGTFFVNTGNVGHPNRLTWDEIHEMVAAGMTIGDHTRTHQYLTKQTDAQLVREITDARTELQQQTGQPINELAYPFGDYDQRIIDYVKKDGFLAARAFSFGVQHDATERFDLKIVLGTDSLKSFVKYLPK